MDKLDTLPADKLDRSNIRAQMRSRRRQLPYPRQLQAARQVDRVIAAAGLMNRSRDITLYFANDGEIDPRYILQRACRRAMHCYLPVLTANNRLWFVRYRPGEPLRNNRYGIPEPTRRHRRRSAWSLGLVLLPLVAFDRSGARLGMGGGFYDRSFSTIRRHPAMARPRLVGLAHQCQEVASLPTASWDIPLTYIATDRELIRADST